MKQLTITNTRKDSSLDNLQDFQNLWGVQSWSLKIYISLISGIHWRHIHERIGMETFHRVFSMLSYWRQRCLTLTLQLQCTKVLNRFKWVLPFLN
jgi:hypothetical protein